LRFIDHDQIVSSDLSLMSSARITGTAGDDFLDGSAGADKISGLAGNDYILGEAGDDTLLGGDGADTLKGGAGDDRLNGGRGVDRATLDYSSSVNGLAIDISGFVAGQAIVIDDGQGGHDTLTNIEQLYVTGTSGADTITGSAANDRIETHGGADLVDAGDGDDFISHAVGPTEAIATIDGGAGDDTLYAPLSSTFHVSAQFDGGDGFDTFEVDATGSSSAITSSLVGGVASVTSEDGAVSVQGVNVERLIVYGGAADDHLSGGKGADLLVGGEGADVLTGGGGDDRLGGGDFESGSNDRINGGAGHDLYWVNTDSSDGVVLDFSTLDVSGKTVAVADGHGGHDHLHSIEGVYLFGNGYESNDTLIGSRGGDLLQDLYGDDLLKGGFGDDTLEGGAGQDKLVGGQGADTFTFSSTSDSSSQAADLIAGLTNDDVIDLSHIDANIKTGADDAFTLVSAFDHHAGQATLSYDADSGLTLLQMDVDGDGVADSVIDIKDDHHDFTNFVL
jgi:Ca2+-binding RTX toxin-like protein